MKMICQSVFYNRKTQDGNDMKNNKRMKDLFCIESEESKITKIIIFVLIVSVQFCTRLCWIWLYT